MLRSFALLAVLACTGLFITITPASAKSSKDTQRARSVLKSAYTKYANKDVTVCGLMTENAQQAWASMSGAETCEEAMAKIYSGYDKSTVASYRAAARAARRAKIKFSGKRKALGTISYCHQGSKMRTQQGLDKVGSKWLLNTRVGGGFGGSC